MRYLVLQTHDIGDVMLSTALCNAIKAHEPGARVDMLTMEHCKGVVVGNPNIDELLVLDKARRSSVGYMLGLLRGIRRRRYDVVLNVQGQIIGLLTCLVSGARRRVGFDKLPWRLFHTDHVVLRGDPEETGHGHTIDDRFGLLRPLGIPAEERSYRIWLAPEEIEHGRERLAAAGVDLARPVVALGVHARDDYKKWPLEHFAEVAAWLVERYDAQLYVFFGPGEEEYGRGLAPLLPETARGAVFDGIRTGSIRELAALMSHCALYVGNDTGPRHIAQALDVPALAIVSPSSCKWSWIPWGHPRFRAVDTGDALGMPEDEWARIQARIQPGVDDAEWFVQLDAGAVKAALAEMLQELGGPFAGEPAAPDELTRSR